MKRNKMDVILTTAMMMFARYGIKKTSIDDIAHMARVAKGTIYNYLGSKNQIYIGVLKKEADEILKNILLSVEKVNTPEEKLRAFVRAKFRYMRKALNLLNIERKDMEKCLPAVEIILNDFFDQEVKIIDSILRQGIEKGIFHLEDVLLTAKAIVYALKGFEFNWLIRENEEAIENYLIQLLNILFFGIVAEQKPTARN